MPPIPLPTSSSSSSSSSSSQHQQQQTAVLALLNEMRALELNYQQRSSEYARERASILDTLSKQGAYITQLETAQKSLMGQNAILNKRMSNMLSRLDKFATGCWQFSSSSVKKMSEALHVQVHEWTRSYGIETALKASSEEEEAIENTTMEKIQGMHLEIMMLKRSNRELRKRMLGRGSRGDGRVREATTGTDGGSGSGQLEHDDEVSHMSGMTQMTSATGITGITQATTTTDMSASTAKLMVAMAAFLDTHDGRGGGRHEGGCEVGATADAVVATVGDVTSKTGSGGLLRKKSVQIAPPSILKSTARYDRRYNKSNREEPSVLLHPGDATKTKKTARHERLNPGLPKSPKMRLNAGGTGSGRRPSTREGKSAAPPAAASDQTNLDFANFNGDFEGTDENGMWPASWGDDASEV
jgi:hypothetical protein